MAELEVITRAAILLDRTRALAARNAQLLDEYRALREEMLERLLSLHALKDRADAILSASLEDAPYRSRNSTAEPGNAGHFR